MITCVRRKPGLGYLIHSWNGMGTCGPRDWAEVFGRKEFNEVHKDWETDFHTWEDSVYFTEIL